MDIECPNCGEPWDTYHLKNDEPYEWGIMPSERHALMERGRFDGATDPVRKAAEACGWRYASDSLLSILNCPSCRDKDALPDAEGRRARVIGCASVLDGDEDAMASELAN